MKFFSPKKLKFFRTYKKLSQADLGKKIGQIQPAISHYETGAKTPTLSTLLKLTKALDVEIDDLLEGEF